MGIVDSEGFYGGYTHSRQEIESTHHITMGYY